MILLFILLILGSLMNKVANWKGLKLLIKLLARLNEPIRLGKSLG